MHLLYVGQVNPDVQRNGVGLIGNETRMPGVCPTDRAVAKRNTAEQDMIAVDKSWMHALLHAEVFAEVDLMIIHQRRLEENRGGVLRPDFMGGRDKYILGVGASASVRNFNDAAIGAVLRGIGKPW